MASSTKRLPAVEGLSGPAPGIRTAAALARSLAGHARAIRDASLAALAREAERGALGRLRLALQASLNPDLSAADFADGYAQTITSGLLAAVFSYPDRLAGPGGAARLAAYVAGEAPEAAPLPDLLRAFLQAGWRPEDPGRDELGIQAVVDLLCGTEVDLPAILDDFASRTGGEDPVAHFYAHFLAAYDRRLKARCGVFYTPRPVVAYIVGGIHELLRREFGLQDGLASTATWGDMAGRGAGLSIPAGTAPDTPFVQILDPAAGTAIFLVEAIDVIYRALSERWQREGLTEPQQRRAWNDYVPRHLLPRLHGYELLMPAYAIAHMSIGLKLRATGYRFRGDERVRVYLANALEPAPDVESPQHGRDRAFAESARAADSAKRHRRFTVVIGNPPYAKISSNRRSAAEALVAPFKAAVRAERNIQPLSDDYLKFLGFVLRASAQVPAFAFGLITNRGYLDGLIHRGVRQVLLDTFERMWIVDLHGDSNIGEAAPAGRANENVLEIQQGVAIALGLKDGQARRSALRCDCWGTRGEKLAGLPQLAPGAPGWVACQPQRPHYFFQPPAGAAPFELLLRLDQMMPTTGTGIKTHRDALVVGFDQASVLQRIAEFADPHRTDAQVRARFFGAAGGRYAPGDNRDWSLSQARRTLQREPAALHEFIRPIDYRPFDTRYIFYHPAAIDYARADLMAHMHRGRNLGLVATRQAPSGEFCHVFVTRRLIDMKTGSHDRGTNLFPLYLYDSAEPTGRRPNFAEPALAALATRLKLPRAEPHGLPLGLAPEDILCYAYALLHSPGYRARYRELLRIDFPHLPLTSSLDLFRALARLGGELVALHLLESPALDRPLTAYTGPAHPIVEAVAHQRETVWLDRAQTRGFQGVPAEVWNAQVGGYQVCRKWLSDRVGRSLAQADLAHYARVVAALHHTLRLQAAIEAAIERHGGWPGAFGA